MRIMYYELTRCYRLPFAGRTSKQNLDQPTAAARNPALPIYRWVREHCFPFQSSESPKSGRVNAADLWLRYRQGQHPVARLLRVLIPFLSYFLLATVIYQLFGSPSQPLRGDRATDAIFQWSRFGMPENSALKGHIIVNLAFFLLTFLTIDAARHCCGSLRS